MKSMRTGPVGLVLLVASVLAGCNGGPHQPEVSFGVRTAKPALAATYAVSTFDELVTAVATVNAGPGGDTIALAPGVYTAAGSLQITRPDVTIAGDSSAPSILDGVRLTFFADSGQVRNLTAQNADVAWEGGATNMALTLEGVTIIGGGFGQFGNPQAMGILRNSTLVGTGAVGSVGIRVAGGTLKATNVTIVGHETGVLVAGPNNFTTSLEAVNVIASGNGRDCVQPATPGPLTGGIITGSRSLGQDGSCPGFTTGNAFLAPLASNGGPTQTLALLSGSDAINAGYNAACPATDQRGFSRLGPCDIGAYEFGGSPPGGNTPVGTNVQVTLADSATPTNPVTVSFSSVTTAGNTTLTTGIACAPVTGFAFGSPPICFELATTAAYVAPIQICVQLGSTVFPIGTAPALVHYVNGVATPVPTTVSGPLLACGDVSSLSPFAVLGQDVRPPILHLPPDIATDATSPSGAVVAYAVTATDNVDPNPAASCAPGSGSLFPINLAGGSTKVTCSATDAAGNVAPPAAFFVHVRGAVEQVARLLELVESLNLDRRVERRLEQIVRRVARGLAEGNERRACGGLDAFVRAVEELAHPEDEREVRRGAPVTPDQASRLVGAATRIELVLACPRSPEEGD